MKKLTAEEKQAKEEQRELYSFIGKTLYSLIKEYNEKKRFKESERENSLKKIAEKLKQELEAKNIFWDIKQCKDQTNKSFFWFADNFELKGTENRKIFVTNINKIPKKYSGIVVYKQKNRWSYKDNDYRVESINWYKEGLLHRTDGPAIEFTNGTKQWWIEGIEYSREKFKTLDDTSVFLEIKRGRFNLEWIKYLTETGIEEFPVIPGMSFAEIY